MSLIIFPDANVQGLSDAEVKELQSLAFNSVHTTIKTDFNDSAVRVSENRFSDRGHGDDFKPRHYDVIKQKVLIPTKMFPKIPLKVRKGNGAPFCTCPSCGFGRLSWIHALR